MDPMSLAMAETEELPELQGGMKIALPMTALEEVSAATGLEESTCLELLNKGWSLVERVDEVNRWEGPMSSLKAQTTAIVVIENGE